MKVMKMRKEKVKGRERTKMKSQRSKKEHFITPLIQRKKRIYVLSKSQ
jgi:hypothetical protein